ncbi:MAG: C39 family peptidase [Thermodesulfobacteriota bacterium]
MAPFIRKLSPFIVFSLFLALASCATVERGALIRAVEERPGSGAYIEDVPFFPRTGHMCGPAALASVVSYWSGEGADPEEIASDVYVERLKGTLPMDMLIYAREQGFDASYYNGGMDDLKEKVFAGFPLILFLNLGLRSVPVGHYVVVVGYSDPLASVLVHSGLKGEGVMGYAELERAWSKTGHSTLLIRPKAAPGAPQG